MNCLNTVPRRVIFQEHIRSLEEEKFVREEQFIRNKEAILHLYSELEMEPR
jgi:hypothetical protein